MGAREDGRMGERERGRGREEERSCRAFGWLEPGPPAPPPQASTAARVTPVGFSECRKGRRYIGTVEKYGNRPFGDIPGRPEIHGVCRSVPRARPGRNGRTGYWKAPVPRGAGGRGGATRCGAGRPAGAAASKVRVAAPKNRLENIFRIRSIFRLDPSPFFGCDGPRRRVGRRYPNIGADT